MYSKTSSVISKQQLSDEFLNGFCSCEETPKAVHTAVCSEMDVNTIWQVLFCLAFTFKSPPKRKDSQRKKLQVHKLRDPRVKNNLKVMLEGRLHCVAAAEPEEQWKQTKTILQETTTEVVGLSTRKKPRLV